MTTVLLRQVRAAALPCLLLAGGCRERAREETATTETVLVSVEAAKRGSIRPVVMATGTVTPAPDGEQLVAAPQSARIVEIPAAAGDPVHKGDLLVRFEIPAAESERSARESDLARAEARLKNAAAAEQRVTGLFGRGIAARKEVEDAEREMAEAQAALTEAKSGRSAAAVLAGRATVRALFDGVVAARTHNAGDLVDPAATEPILRVIDPRRLQVEASIPVSALSTIAAGSTARILGPSGFEPAEARVRGLPVAVDSRTGAVVVRLDFVAPQRLPAGTPVEVEIQGPERPDVLLVPAAAIVREGESAYVYVVDEENKAHRVEVRLGTVTDQEAEVISGIEDGAKVVVHGQNALPDGASVSIES